MRRFFSYGGALGAAALVVAISSPVELAAQTRRPGSPPPLPASLEAAICTAASCGSRPASARYGTAIGWLDDGQRARARAHEEGKLLLVLHLSGNFAKQQFT